MTGMESAEAQANYCRIVALLVQDKAKKDAAEKARAPRVDAVAGHSTPPARVVARPKTANAGTKDNASNHCFNAPLAALIMCCQRYRRSALKLQ